MPGAMQQRVEHLQGTAFFKMSGTQRFKLSFMDQNDTELDDSKPELLSSGFLPTVLRYKA